MTTKVYTFRKVRMSNESALECFAEIERGRSYYNAMIDELNKRVQEDLDYIEEAAYGAYGDTEAAKTCQVKLIFRAIKRHSRDVRAHLPASSSGCYTGTYHAVQASFDQATSSKRIGVWPGEKFARRYPGDGGESVGVHIQGGATTWGDICRGKTSMFVANDYRNKRGSCSLKISKTHTTNLAVWWHDGGRNQRVIPDDSIVSHALLCLVSDYGTAPVSSSGKPRGKWALRITAKLPDAAITTKSDAIGVSLGWSQYNDGSILVAVTSDGRELRIPSYACVKITRKNETRSERDQLANAVKEYLPIKSAKWIPRSASAVSSYIERHGLDVRADIDSAHRELFAKFLERDTQLRRKEVRFQRRFIDIRNDHFKKFSSAISGLRLYIEKLELKALAESPQEKEDIGATVRFMAGITTLQALLRNSGAEEVPFLGDERERLGDEREPTLENARKILVSGTEGKRHRRSARKAVRKYRRRPRNLDAPQDAPAMAL